MSSNCSPHLSWVVLLLFLSSTAQRVSSVRPPVLSQRERGGTNPSIQTYPQGAPLPINRRTDDQEAASERESYEKTSSESTDREKAASNRASESAANVKVISKREASNNMTIERPSKRQISQREASESETSNKLTSSRAAGDENAGTLCAYRVLEDSEEGRLCFRHTQEDFTCLGIACRQVRSAGGHLVANMLSNGSVLLRWTYDGQGRSDTPGRVGVLSEAPAPTVTPAAGGEGKTLPKSPSRGQQGGFRMGCWWNGSYTQFECPSVVLGSSCRDFLLTELHENVPYRICLQPLLAFWDGRGTGKLQAQRKKMSVENWDEAGCVDFSVSPSGMQDIVIAMTTVGGAICVMLVIICLLVAYITENIMSPSVQHTLTARHSTRSHNTHL